MAILAGGHYAFALATSGKLKLLGEFDKGAAFRGEGGVRVSVGPFEIVVMGRFEQYKTSYTGLTDTKLSATQYLDVELTDTLSGAQATVGFSF